MVERVTTPSDDSVTETDSSGKQAECTTCMSWIPTGAKICRYCQAKQRQSSFDVLGARLKQFDGVKNAFMSLAAIIGALPFVWNAYYSWCNPPKASVRVKIAQCTNSIIKIKLINNGSSSGYVWNFRLKNQYVETRVEASTQKLSYDQKSIPISMPKWEAASVVELPPNMTAPIEVELRVTFGGIPQQLLSRELTFNTSDKDQDKDQNKHKHPRSETDALSTDPHCKLIPEFADTETRRKWVLENAI